MQDEVRAESLQQSLELHMLQVGIHRPCELNELPRKSHGTQLRRGNATPILPWLPEKVIWKQLMTQGLQHLHSVHVQGTNPISSCQEIQPVQCLELREAISDVHCGALYWATGIYPNASFLQCSQVPVRGWQGHVPSQCLTGHL